MLVNEIMIKNVFTAHPEQTIKELLTIMIENKIGGVPVIDENGKLLGMISDGDILRHISPRKQTIHDYFLHITVIPDVTLSTAVKTSLQQPVSRLLNNRKIVTLSQEDDLSKAVSLISKHHFKKIPVVDTENRVVGVVSRGDAIRMIYKDIIEKI
ncbi:CBS domain-containing protein [Actinomycetes bacterium NPDC127524]